MTPRPSKAWMDLASKGETEGRGVMTKPTARAERSNTALKTTYTIWAETSDLCRKCRSPLELNYIHDAVACRKCDRWMESCCEDPSCWARCAQRPDRPSAAVESVPLPATANPTHFLSRLHLRLGGPALPPERGP